MDQADQDPVQNLIEDEWKKEKESRSSQDQELDGLEREKQSAIEIAERKVKSFEDQPHNHREEFLEEIRQVRTKKNRILKNRSLSKEKKNSIDKAEGSQNELKVEIEETSKANRPDENLDDKTEDASMDAFTLKYKAMYDYTAGAESELDFKKGDILYCEGQPHGQWLKAKIYDRIGYIPLSYVEIVNQETEDVAEKRNEESDSREDTHWRDRQEKGNRDGKVKHKRTKHRKEDDKQKANFDERRKLVEGLLLGEQTATK